MSVFRPRYRQLTEHETALVAGVKDIAQKLYDAFGLAETDYNKREMALARTKLEEAVMWAVKGIT